MLFNTGGARRGARPAYQGCAAAQLRGLAGEHPLVGTKVGTVLGERPVLRKKMRKSGWEE